MATKVFYCLVFLCWRATCFNQSFSSWRGLKAHRWRENRTALDGICDRTAPLGPSGNYWRWERVPKGAEIFESGGGGSSGEPLHIHSAEMIPHFAFSRNDVGQMHLLKQHLGCISALARKFAAGLAWQDEAAQRC